MKLVILDRDGVINIEKKEGFIVNSSEFKLICGAGESIAKLSKAGFKIVVATNQSVVGRKIITEEKLADIHKAMLDLIAQKNGKIDKIYHCSDHPNNPTNRRKPAAGMLEEALQEYSAIAAETPFIGDALRDMQAAFAAKCPRYLVKTGKGVNTINSGWEKNLEPVYIFNSIVDATEEIINRYG